ncbi:hypothetical protein Hanom_Chr08g00751581 [Helianthus anomalus]
MPTTTLSQSSMSLLPIPPQFQKNNETAQKKTTSIFQGSKPSVTSSSINTDNGISLLYSQMKSYMEQQNKTNQKILCEIEDIKKQKKPTEDQSLLMPRVLDFVTLTSTTQQSKGPFFKPQGSFILQQGSLVGLQTNQTFSEQFMKCSVGSSFMFVSLLNKQRRTRNFVHLVK